MRLIQHSKEEGKKHIEVFMSEEGDLLIFLKFLPRQNDQKTEFNSISIIK